MEHSECVCLLQIPIYHPNGTQAKVVHVWDVKAMYDIFVKELDTYPEPIQYV